MTHNNISRREFLIMSAKGFGAAVISYGLMGCSGNDDDGIPASFEHGIASGDPLADAVILWTRVTPEREGDVKVSWKVATDEAFTQLVTRGETTTSAERDYTVKVDAIGLSAGTTYYYRFETASATSVTGMTKTLPQGAVDSVKLAVFSCSNYPAGFFNAYDMAADMGDIDAALHVGDYIYEYGPDIYAYDNARELGREVLPASSLVSLSDYRTRYGQYRTDAKLQKIHARIPFICVWDDHEIANDTWREGAEAHDADVHGDFDQRKASALQAYFEWLPIRPWSEGNNLEIYRRFTFGNLVELHMLDTRVLARDLQLDYANYIDPTTGALDQAGFVADVSDASRTMLGAEQLQWLQEGMTQSDAHWQVLGQQVIMGQMTLPAAVATQQMTIAQYAELGALATLAGRVEAGDPTVTDDELAYLAANQERLTPEVIALLQLPHIPYNLDAWDGYAYEREVIFQTAKAMDKNLVVVSGDTHNSWANDLKDQSGELVGVEFAGTSVTSPGMEQYLGIPLEQQDVFQDAIVNLVDNLHYTNLVNRGFMTVTFTQTEARAEWRYVDTILSETYSENETRRAAARTVAGTPGVEMV